MTILIVSSDSHCIIDLLYSSHLIKAVPHFLHCSSIVDHYFADRFLIISERFLDIERGQDSLPLVCS